MPRRFPVLSFWRARRGRKAAVAALRPYVEETRRAFGPDCGAVWEHPYAVGFLVNLITLAAAEAADPEPTEALGLVQSESWQALTGVPAGLIGQKISLLSIADDAHFISGRDNAFIFFEAMRNSQRDPLQLLTETAGSDPSAFRLSASRTPAQLAELWNELLHARVRPAPAGLQSEPGRGTPTG